MSWLTNTWNDIVAYFIKEELWLTIGKGFLKLLIIFLLTSLVIRFGKMVIRNVFKIKSRGPVHLSEKRQTTLIKLLENVLTYVIYFIVLVMTLEVFGVEITAILAGAGVVGLAVGFGAQNLVKDIITGFFIIFENQFSVGDYVRIGTFEGTVEEIGLRTTKMKGITGELFILPNGSIMEVTNLSVYNGIAIVDISISLEGDIHYAEQVIEELLQELPSKYEEIVNVPELLGVQGLGPSEVILRINAETTPMNHWKIARAIRKEVKLRLDERGIEIPFPRLVMYNKQEEEKQKEKPKKEMGTS